MQALVQTVESLIAAVACMAFAHFGVALKDCPEDRASAQVVRKVPVSTPATPRLVDDRTPRDLARDVRRI
jgi:hypothetical protein